MHDAGDLDSTGHFTVAGQEAAARLATFAEAIPHYVLLRLVQAGVCAGVHTIQVSDTPSRSVVRFHGGQWSPAELQVLSQDLGRGLTAPDDRPLHHLAFALGASRGAGKDVRVKVTSTSELEVTLSGTLGLVTVGLSGNHVVPIPRLRAVPVQLEYFEFALMNTIANAPCKPRCDPPPNTLAELVRGQPMGRGVAPVTISAALYDAPVARGAGLPWEGLVLRHWQLDLEGWPLLQTGAAFRGAGSIQLPRSHLVAYVGTSSAVTKKAVTTEVDFVKYGVSVAQKRVRWGLPVPEVIVEADDLPVDLSGLTALANDDFQKRLEQLRFDVVAALNFASDYIVRQGPPRGGPPQWLSYGVIAAGFGLGLVTWQPALPIAGMVASAMLFGASGTQEQKARQFAHLKKVLDPY